MLRAVYYAEFDNILGPVVLFDAPPGAVSGGSPCLFDAISDYAITGPQLRSCRTELAAPKSSSVLPLEPRSHIITFCVSAWCVTFLAFLLRRAS